MKPTMGDVTRRLVELGFLHVFHNGRCECGTAQCKILEIQSAVVVRGVVFVETMNHSAICPLVDGKGHILRAGMSRTLKGLLDLTENHDPSCGCGACCALTGWSEEDEQRALEEDSRA